jgi:transposase
MTPAEEARFIQLWQEGTETAAIAQALGIPVGTVKSRAHTLARQGKQQARPRRGAYPRQTAQGRQQETPASPAPQVSPATPATPMVERKDVQQWTVRLSKVLIDHLKAVAYERRIPPSQLVEELMWTALTYQAPSTPEPASTPDRNASWTR